VITHNVQHNVLVAGAVRLSAVWAESKLDVTLAVIGVSTTLGVADAFGERLVTGDGLTTAVGVGVGVGSRDASQPEMVRLRIRKGDSCGIHPMFWT
jgi:hypothetical protein